MKGKACHLFIFYLLGVLISGCVAANYIEVSFDKQPAQKSAAIAQMICPNGYVAIPANGSLNVEEFCIMKYEAKAWQDDNGDSQITISELDETTWSFNANTWTSVDNLTTTHKPVSHFNKKPWTTSMVKSWSMCDDLNSETLRIGIDTDQNSDGTYALTSNPEWMTMARNIESVAINWTSGIVGNGCIKQGNISQNYFCNDIQSGFNGTNFNIYTVPSGLTSSTNQLAKLIFSNGEEIWDLAGNLYEWVDWRPDNVPNFVSWTTRAHQSGNYNAIEFNNLDTNIDITDQMFPDSWSPLDGSLNGANGVGRYFGSKQDFIQPGGGAARGGAFSLAGQHSGIYGLHVGFHMSLETWSWYDGFICVRSI
jgi:hypothetical protein